jgi:hypothetical protein
MHKVEATTHEVEAIAHDRSQRSHDMPPVAQGVVGATHDQLLSGFWSRPTSGGTIGVARAAEGPWIWDWR